MAEQGMRELQCSEAMVELASFGQSEAMEPVLQKARRASQTCVPVFLSGEHGTGKRLLATVIHGQSDRCLHRLIELDGRTMSILPSPLDEVEAGREPGTSGDFAWWRVFELAGPGTLYISHVESLSMATQRQLLEAMTMVRNVEGPAFGLRPRLIISNTSDLSQALNDGRLLPALYWRLQVMPISIPPLRDRPDEIPGLVMGMLTNAASTFSREGMTMEEDAMELLLSHDWPGNLHELQACVHHSFFAAEGDHIRIEDLPAELTHQRSDGKRNRKREVALDFPSLASALVREGLGQLSPQADNAYQHVVDRVEKELIAQVLEACNYVQTKAATRLGINRNTLHKKVKEYGLESLGPPGDANQGG